MSMTIATTRESQIEYMNMNESFCRPPAFLRPVCLARRGGHPVPETTTRAPDAQRVRIRFDSREFFDLLQRYPKLLPYVTAGRNVQVALGDRVYEVYE
jgi:hypothetical protein